MKTRNNFDMSSSGVNIDAVCYYDTIQAADNFRTFISEQHSDRYTLYIYGVRDEDEEIVTIRDFCKFAPHVKKQDLIDLADELPDWDGGDYADYTMSELREMILKANPAMILNRYWAESSTISIKPEYTLQRTVGYSQGDIERVLIPSGDLNDRGFIDHLFWDSPVYCRVEINGTEYYWDEVFESEYDWDKEKMINYVCSNLKDGIDPEYVRKTLGYLLPETPDWN